MKFQTKIRIERTIETLLPGDYESAAAAKEAALQPLSLAEGERVIGVSVLPQRPEVNSLATR